MFDDFRREEESEAEIESEQLPTFYRHVQFWPETPIVIDTTGKFSASALGLLTGLAHFSGSQITLKPLVLKKGFRGAERVFEAALHEWKQDIVNHQLLHIASGYGPVNSLVKLLSGVSALVQQPVQQYRRDGRLVRGFQRGVHTFSASSLAALLDLSASAFSSVQSLASTLHEVVSPAPCGPPRQRRGSRRQAKDAKEAAVDAYRLISEGVAEHAARVSDTLAREEALSRGLTGRAGGLVRQLPSTLVQPLLLGAEAAACVARGARNSVQPAALASDQNKYKQFAAE